MAGGVMNDFPLTPGEAIAAASLITTHVAEKAGMTIETAKADGWRAGYMAACERYGIELGTYGDKIPDHPYYSDRAIQLIADLIPRWKGWAERLRTWGAANLASGGVVIEPDVSGFEAVPTPVQIPVSVPAETVQMSTVDLVAALRASVEAAKARRAAEQAKHPQHLAPGRGFAGGPVILDETTELTAELAAAVAASTAKARRAAEEKKR
jgi:hypothetical protein